MMASLHPLDVRLPAEVVRHLRARVFPETTTERRLRFVGAALHSGSATDVAGLDIADEAVLHRVHFF